MIVVAGFMVIDEADMDQAKTAALQMMQETAKEKGYIVYRFSVDIEHAGHLRIYEEWETPEDLAAHSKSSHMQIYRKTLSKLNVISRDVKMFEAGKTTQL